MGCVHSQAVNPKRMRLTLLASHKMILRGTEAVAMGGLHEASAVKSPRAESEWSNLYWGCY